MSVKRRHVLRGLGYGSLLLVVPILIPGSPVYLPELLASSSDYDGRSARSWARDLESPDAEQRRQASFAVGAIGEPAKKHVPKLASMMLDDPDDEVRIQASLALSKIGPAALEAVPALSKALSDKDPLVRMNAARTLQRQGRDAEASAPALIAALKDETNDVYVERFVVTVHETIALALGRVTAGTTAGVPALMEALSAARTNRTKRMIIRALGEVGPQAQAAVPVLLEMQDSNDKVLRDTVRQALEQIGAGQVAAPAPAAPALARLAEEERAYLWDIEHHGNVLSKYGFGRLASAIRDADRPVLEAMLAAGFSGNDLLEPRRVRFYSQFAEVERLQDAGRPSTKLDRSAFVARLLEFRKAFTDSAPQVKLALMTLRPQNRDSPAGPWEGTAQLRLAGEHSRGAPAEIVAHLRFVVPEPTEESLAKPGWLQSAGLTQLATARAPAYLFAEVAKERGLQPDRLHDNWNSPTLIPTTGGAYVCDFDRDGCLDVLITDVETSHLFRGTPNGRFEEATTACGLPEPGKMGGMRIAAWADIDGDGWEDLLLGARIFRNVRGRFSDATSQCNLHLPTDASAILPADYDRDGKLDLYFTRTSRPGTGSWLNGTSSETRGNVLYRNRGNWQFENVTRASGTWGGGRSTFTAAWLDANNDGWPDLHVANEFGDGALLVNQKNGTFTEHRLADRPADFGTMGLTVGDVNNDGNIDIYCSNMYSKAGTRVIGNLRSDAYPPDVMEKMRRFVAGGELHLNRGGLKFEQAAAKMQVAAVGWAYGACLADLDSDGFLDLYATAGYISRNRTEPDG
jgi:hypothetical protein